MIWECDLVHHISPVSHQLIGPWEVWMKVIFKLILVFDGKGKITLRWMSQDLTGGKSILVLSTMAWSKLMWIPRALGYWTRLNTMEKHMGCTQRSYFLSSWLDVNYCITEPVTHKEQFPLSPWISDIIRNTWLCSSLVFCQLYANVACYVVNAGFREISIRNVNNVGRAKRNQIDR